MYDKSRTQSKTHQINKVIGCIIMCVCLKSLCWSYLWRYTQDQQQNMDILIQHYSEHCGVCTTTSTQPTLTTWPSANIKTCLGLTAERLTPVKQLHVAATWCHELSGQQSQYEAVPTLNTGSVLRLYIRFSQKNLQPVSFRTCFLFALISGLTMCKPPYHLNMKPSNILLVTGNAYYPWFAAERGQVLGSYVSYHSINILVPHKPLLLLSSDAMLSHI